MDCFDLVLCDFYLFPELTKKFVGNKYEVRRVLISAVNRHLSSRSTSWFSEGIQKRPRRWQTCIELGGEYFDIFLCKIFNGF